jgi:hypothetical protein|eukprot:m.86410 g.86410  ORF g.86410 m.86410 type:complete len:73 (-) comp19844_c0_seq2:6-224(-)
MYSHKVTVITKLFMNALVDHNLCFVFGGGGSLRGPRPDNLDPAKPLVVAPGQCSLQAEPCFNRRGGVHEVLS